MSRPRVSQALCSRKATIIYTWPLFFFKHIHLIIFRRFFQDLSKKEMTESEEITLLVVEGGSICLYQHHKLPPYSFLYFHWFWSLFFIIVWMVFFLLHSQKHFAPPSPSHFICSRSQTSHCYNWKHSSFSNVFLHRWWKYSRTDEDDSVLSSILHPPELLTGRGSFSIRFFSTTIFRQSHILMFCIISWNCNIHMLVI